MAFVLVDWITKARAVSSKDQAALLVSALPGQIVHIVIPVAQWVQKSFGLNFKSISDVTFVQYILRVTPGFKLTMHL